MRAADVLARRNVHNVTGRYLRGSTRERLHTRTLQRSSGFPKHHWSDGLGVFSDNEVAAIEQRPLSSP